jgi:hypothetical protein
MVGLEQAIASAASMAPDIATWAAFAGVTP